MKKQAEKISLLSLSLMLISSFSISSALPLMLEHFQGYAPEQVELLISIPSFFVMGTLLANSLLTRLLSERQMIVSGLLILTVAGVIPFFNQAYGVILVSRMFFGVGTGVINAKAISIISERYTGRERVTLLGLRGSAEVVGSAFLTALVGLVLQVNWSWAFLVYGFGLVILLAYLLFVPAPEQEAPSVTDRTKESLTSSLFWKSVFVAGIAGWIICINSSISLRIPLLVTGAGMGSAADASMVLSFQQLIGIVAGLAFASALDHFKNRLLGWTIVGLGASLLAVALASNLLFLGAAAVGTGFFYSLILTTIFHQLSEDIPPLLLNSATAIVLLGCNAGSALSPYILKGIGLLSLEGGQIFAFYSLTCFMMGGVFLFLKTKNQPQKEGQG